MSKEQSGPGGPQVIELNSLPLPQINQLSQSLDQELEFLNTSIQRLRGVQRRFVESMDAVKKVGASKPGGEILIPLTSSLYVPGELTDTQTVLIDIGTGYYVEKTVSDAAEYFSLRNDEISKEIEDIQPALRQKAAMKQIVMQVLQTKLQAQLAGMQQRPGGQTAPLSPGK